MKLPAKFVNNQLRGAPHRGAQGGCRCGRVGTVTSWAAQSFLRVVAATLGTSVRIDTVALFQ